MKIFTVLALCLASAFAGPRDWAKTVKWMDTISVNRGASVRMNVCSPASVGQFPWQVAVIGQSGLGTWFCGGSLISNQWVLTAAHCIQGGSSYTLHLGGISLSDVEAGRLTLTSNMAIIHPNYNSNTLHNDISLIRLPTIVEFSERMHPVALVAGDDFVDAGRALTISGWGSTCGAVNEFLNYIVVTSISNAQCAAIHGSSIIITSTLCTSSSPNHGACAIDSGGPLVSVDQNGSATLVGVASFGGAAGCNVGVPSRFTRVQSFLNWIAAITGVAI